MAIIFIAITGFVILIIIIIIIFVFVIQVCDHTEKLTQIMNFSTFLHCQSTIQNRNRILEYCARAFDADFYKCVHQLKSNNVVFSTFSRLAVRKIDIQTCYLFLIVDQQLLKASLVLRYLEKNLGQYISMRSR